MPPLARPDVLVLAAGGILGEAWMSGVLAGIEDASGFDLRDCESFVGTSAGSIVAARLAAGERARRPRGRDRGADAGFVADAGAAGAEGDPPPAGEPSGDRGVLGAALGGVARVGLVATAPIAPLALAAGAPVGARLRALALARIPDGSRRLDALHAEIASLRSRFDGRLRVCVVDRDSGRRVAFGRPGDPVASVADAVTASCSIPWIFRSLPIGGRRYVDGGVWSLTNLDVAPAGRDSQILCLHPAGGNGLSLGSPFALARSALASAAEVEAFALRSRGAHVHMLGPDREAAAIMGVNFMDPRPARAVHSSGYRQGLLAAAG